MKKNKFTGLGTALVTPFGQNCSVDKAALKVLVEQQIAGGVDFFVPCGTTGESPTLTHEEHIKVIESVVQIVNGIVPVLAGTGSNNTVEAVHLTKEAKRVGADGVLVVSPYYNKPTQAGIRDYYLQVAKVGLPVVLYDIPGRCGGSGVSAETILCLAHNKIICGLKWASGNLEQLQEVLAGRPRGFTVLSGDDNLTFTAMALGADGVISVLSNLLPKVMWKFVRAIINCDREGSRQEHYRLLPLMRAMFLETNPIPVKTALAWVYPGVYKEAFRSPLVAMRMENKEKLRRALEKYGLSSSDPDQSHSVYSDISREKHGRLASGFQIPISHKKAPRVARENHLT